MGRNSIRQLIRSRKRIIELKDEEKKRMTEVARVLGVSRKTCHKWYNRYHKVLAEGGSREEAENSLVDKSSRPHRFPKETPTGLKEAVLKIREERRYGPLRIANELAGKISPSGVYQVLKRRGENRLRSYSKPEEAQRYEKDRFGQLVHIDLKYIGHIGRKGRRYQFSAVDGATRRAFSRIYPRKGARQAKNFFLLLLACWGQGRIEAVLTDNGLEFTHFKNKRDHPFARLLREEGIKHRLTRVRRPQTNGKVERFQRTLAEEFYASNFFETVEGMEEALQRWLFWYNHKRRHQGLKGKTPMGKYHLLEEENLTRAA